MQQPSSQVIADTFNVRDSLTQDRLPEVLRTVIPVHLQQTLRRVQPDEAGISYLELLRIVGMGIIRAIFNLPIVIDLCAGRSKVIAGNFFVPMQRGDAGRRVYRNDVLLLISLSVVHDKESCLSNRAAGVSRTHLEVNAFGKVEGISLRSNSDRVSKSQCASGKEHGRECR